MSMALAFDTLRAAKQLQQSGFEETQAEAIVSIASDRQEELATKSDREILRVDLEKFTEVTKAGYESLRELIQAYSESSNKERSWSRWSIGVFAATQLMTIGYILSQLLPAN